MEWLYRRKSGGVPLYEEENILMPQFSARLGALLSFAVSHPLELCGVLWILEVHNNGSLQSRIHVKTTYA